MTFFKKITISAILAVILIPSLSFAERDNIRDLKTDGYQGGVYWSFNEDTGLLQFLGKGEIYDYELNGARPEWDIYNDIAKEIDIGEGITRVGDYAFWGFDKVEKLILPGTCKEIGLEAFSHNDNLTYIYFSEGLETIGDGSFFWNRARFHTELPNSLKTIERDAFYFNEKFSTIVIPEHVERIGDTALNAANAIYFVTEEPPEMPYQISLAQKGTVYVPFGSREKYEQVISEMKSSNPYNPTVNMKNKAAWKVEEYDPLENLIEGWCNEAVLSTKASRLSFNGIKVSCSLDSRTLAHFKETGADFIYDFYRAEEGSEEYRLLEKSADPVIKDKTVERGKTYRYLAAVHFEDTDGKLTHKSRPELCTNCEKKVRCKLFNFLYF